MTPINPATGGSLPPRVSSSKPVNPATTQSTDRTNADRYVASKPASARGAGPSSAYGNAVAGATAVTAGAANGGGATMQDLADTGMYTGPQLAEIAALDMTPAELASVRGEARREVGVRDADKGRSADKASPVAGTQPATTSGGRASVTATIDDIASVGVLTRSELAQVAVSGRSPEELGAFYEGAVEYAAQLEADAADMNGSQPATGAARSLPTIADFAALGMFTEQELAQLARANHPPEQLGAIYEQAVAYAQSPEYAQRQQASEQAAPAGASTGAPAWNKAWAGKFRDMMQDQGIDSKTSMAVIASLKAAPLDEAQLQQQFEYYASSPEGKAELRTANEQMKKSGGMQNAIMLSMGGVALGIAGVTVANGSSRGNLRSALERTAKSGSPERAGIAAKAIKELDADRPLNTKMRADIASSLRAEAAATNRALHPIAKAKLNGGARHVTPSVRLSGKDALQYGLWMKRGDAVSDASKAASTLAGGAAKAAGGAVQAAKGASTLGKFGILGKYVGPIGLVASAGFGAFGISKMVKAEGGFGKESAKMTGSVTGGLAGGVAGAAAGAAIGSAFPILGTGVGAIAGGIVGSIGLGKIGESVGGALHSLFD